MVAFVDYFNARHYSSNQGRFMSRHPAGLAAVDPNNPASWNQYAYTRSGLTKPQAGTPVLRRGAFPGVKAPCETVGKTRFTIFETTSSDSPLNFTDPTGMDECATSRNCLIGWQLGDLNCTLDGISASCKGINPEDVTVCLFCANTNGEPAPKIVGTTYAPYVETNDILIDNGDGTYDLIPGAPTVHPAKTLYQMVPNEAGCGADVFCQAFVGFGDLFINGMPGGAARLAGAEAAGVATTLPAISPTLRAAAVAASAARPGVTAFGLGFVRGLTHAPGTPPNPFAVAGYYTGRYIPAGWALARGLFNGAYERLVDGQ